MFVTRSTEQLTTEGGATFYLTKVGIHLNGGKAIEFPRDFKIPVEQSAYGVPSHYSDGRHQYVFISEAEEGGKKNGWIYEVDEKEHLQAYSVYQQKDLGWYAFWGKPVNGKPALYHFNLDDFYMTQTAFRDGKWETDRIYGTVPSEALQLYKSQVEQADYPNQKDPFNYEWSVQPDSFYEFLKMTRSFEESAGNGISDTVGPKPSPTPYSPNMPGNFSNPFVPIYCRGDDLSRAKTKPTILYEEVAGTRVEIPNMPAIKTQDELGECRAFSMAALMQWHVCNYDKNDILDCKNPPANWSISYFGAMMYTHQDLDKDKTFQPEQSKSRSMYDILNEVKDNAGKFILDSCKPFDRLVNSFRTSGAAGVQKKDQFFTYLKKMYESNKGKTEADILDCPECINEINSKAGVNADIASLKRALTKDSYDKFLYALFFQGCDFQRFPASYQTMAYPIGGVDVGPQDVKKKIIDVLKSGKPVLYPKICFDFRADKSCETGHSVVVSGYKKVCETKNKSSCKDVFKIHNSWGEEWQKINNDGWLDADLIVNSNYRDEDKTGKMTRIESGSILWLD